MLVAPNEREEVTSSRVGFTRLPAPRGIILSDGNWVAEVAKRYQLENLDLSGGSVVLERIVSAGGRCFCYPDGSWIIALSLPRLQRCGRQGMEEILAHELLHAWLWSRHRYAGHGPIFSGHASARSIPRWCSDAHEVQRQGPQQLRLFDLAPEFRDRYSSDRRDPGALRAH